MTYSADTDFWTIDISDFNTPLIERHKYVGTISEHSGGSANMRNVKMLEFAYEEDGLELTLMRLPYEVVVGTSDAFFIWYEVGHIGEDSYKLYIAPAYEGGVGTTYASDPSRDRGDYAESGLYRPDEQGQTWYGRSKQMGGDVSLGEDPDYVEGDEVYMTDDEIRQYMANGGQVEYI